VGLVLSRANQRLTPTFPTADASENSAYLEIEWDLTLMAHVIRFNTATLDVSKERPNPINPIPGESLLLWLRQRARPDVAVSVPDAEDWGWYSTVQWKGRSYMLGSSACEDDGGDWEWILQIEKHRSVTEKLLGRSKMNKDDECAKYFQRLLESEATFKGVSVDIEP